MNVFSAAEDPDVNLALNKPTSQISTYEGAPSSAAVDGAPETSTAVSCTLGAVNPWWSVDLEAAYDVGKVTVRNDANAPVGNYRRT